MDTRFKEENMNCEETHVVFRIMDDELNIAELTKSLNLKPDFYAIKGQCIPGNNRGVLAKKNIWSITSEGLKTTSLENHIWHIVSQLNGRESVINQLKNDGVTVELSCFWMSATGQGGPIISNKALQTMSKLGLDLDFDIYFCDDL